MKISARNVFKGKVTAVKPGAINSEVDLTTAGGDSIAAVVTNDSVSSLGLAVGSEVTALVKASSVLVMAEGGDVKLSARNCLSGTISKITQGPVSAEVTIDLPGGAAVHATITHEANTELGLKVGGSATAVFKASAVILAVAA
ncbi:MAG: TOBE domain-containing protein [Rhodocyclaceae bacterium]